MGLYDNVSLAQARKDLQYMKNTYGEPQDFCGGFCNNDMFEDVLMGKMTVKEAIIKNIEYYFTNGIDVGNPLHGCSSDVKPNSEDSRTKRIMERYFIEE